MPDGETLVHRGIVANIRIGNKAGACELILVRLLTPLPVAGVEVLQKLCEDWVCFLQPFCQVVIHQARFPRPPVRTHNPGLSPTHK